MPMLKDQLAATSAGHWTANSSEHAMNMRFALRLAYDGTDFAGWWRQPGERTVAGCLDEIFTRIGEPQAQVVGASRTDAGVHARGQIAHVDTSRTWDAERLAQILNQQSPADLACTGVAVVADDWHACHKPIGKTYHYTVDHGAISDPFMARYTWRPPYQVQHADLEALAQLIPGRRNWQGFAKRGETRHHDGDLIRTITNVSWINTGALLQCTISGDGFTYRLVRSLVGAMIAVAHGTCLRDDFIAALAGATTAASAQQAPACGLCLEHVAYDPEPRWCTTISTA